MTSLLKKRFQPGALALGLLAALPAQGRNDASTASALPALPLSAGGEVIAFIPNERGRAWLHNERLGG